MRIKEISIIALFVFEIPLYSQGKDITYIDIGIILSDEANYGNGFNYERMLNHHMSFRTGLNIAIDLDGGPSQQTTLGVPVGLTFFTGGNNMFELGIGTGGTLWITGSHTGDFKQLPFLRAGYRYQKKNEKGRFFKAGVELPSNVYLSLFGGGYCF